MAEVQLPPHTFSFPALGSTVELGVRADLASTQALARDLHERVTLFESRFSRFLATSELAALNRSAGKIFAASKPFVDLLLAARRLWVQTNGLVDPTVGASLIAAGYDQSFDQLLMDNPLPAAGEPLPKITFADVTINDQTGHVTLPTGALLDLGGIGKGYLADELAPVVATCSPNYWLSLGGDIAGAGADEHGQPWPIAVQDPRRLEQNVGTLRLPATWAVATSGVTKRKGERAGKSWHHILDPRTGKPAATDVVGATVTAATALEADAFAKTLVILGRDAGLDWLHHQPRCYAILTTRENVFLSDELKPHFTPA